MHNFSHLNIENLWYKLLANKPKKIRTVIQRTVKKLIPDNGECLSHSTALFFHKLTCGDFNKLVFRTATRKKSRILEGFKIIANHFTNSDDYQIEEFFVGDLIVPISSIADCLIDVVSDSALAPPLETIAKIFASYSGCPYSLLEKAHTHSDSALKRCSFWLLWCGRIQPNDLQKFNITKTPVNLDRRYLKNQLWEGICKIYFPSFLINIPVESEITEVSPEQNEWYELRKFAPFCKYCFEQSFLPILNDSRPRKHNILMGFTQSSKLLDSLPNYGELLFSIFKYETSGKSDLTIPAICLRNLASQVKDENTFPWLPKQITRILNKSESKILEAAMHYGIVLGFETEIMNTLTIRGKELVNIGAFSTLRMLCKRLLSKHKHLPSDIYRFMALCHRKKHDNTSALKILKKGLRECEIKPNKHVAIGDIQLSLSSVFMQMKQLKNAEKALEIAAKCFLSSDRKKYGGVLLARGNARFIKGDLVNARNFYLHALKEFKRHSWLEPQSKVFYNLALIEFRRNNYRTSARMFGKAAETYEKLNSQEARSEAMQNQALCLLNIGNTMNSISLLEEAFSNLSGLLNQSFETKAVMLSFLIWAYQVAGFDEIAKLKIEEFMLLRNEQSKGHGIFISELLTALSEMLGTRFVLGEQKLKKIIEKKGFKGRSVEDQAEVMFRYGQACVMQKQKTKEGSEFIKKAYDMLTPFPEKELGKRIALFYGLKSTNTISASELNHVLIDLNKIGTFDPFWLWYAKDILKLNSAAGTEFISSHKARTSSNLIKKTTEKLPELKDTIELIFSSASLPRDTILIKEGKATIQSWNETKIWQNLAKQNLCLDCVEGIITVDYRKIYLRKSTYSFKILCHMLRSPEFSSYQSLYIHIWGVEYDPEWDEQALKAAIYRLRKYLHSVKDIIKLIPRTRYGKRGLKLLISKKWEAIV